MQSFEVDPSCRLAAFKMAPSKCDQKKAEIVRSVEKQCAAETDQVKAIYQLKCLELEEKYEAKYEAIKEQAYRDLEKQKLEELGEIERLYEAELEPLKAEHAQKLFAIREQYHLADPEAGLRTSAISETPSSLTLVTTSVSPSSETVAGLAARSLMFNPQQRLAGQQQAEVSNNDAAAINRSNDDTQESGDETDTSIPAFAPQPTSKATFDAPMKKRKRVMVTFDSDLEDPDFSQNDNGDGQDENSDISFRGSQERPSKGISKAFKGASAQRSGRNTVSSASPTKPSNAVESRNQANSSSRKTDDQAGGGDEEESTCSGPGTSDSNIRPIRSNLPTPYRRPIC